MANFMLRVYHNKNNFKLNYERKREESRMMSKYLSSPGPRRMELPLTEVVTNWGGADLSLLWFGFGGALCWTREVWGA